jgi:hypothetical protein
VDSLPQGARAFAMENYLMTFLKPPGCVIGPGGVKRMHVLSLIKKIYTQYKSGNPAPTLQGEITIVEEKRSPMKTVQGYREKFGR